MSRLIQCVRMACYTSSYALLLMMEATPALADTDLWKGTGSGLWTDGSKWSLGRAPNAGDAAFGFADTSQTITLSGFDAADAFLFGSGSSSTTVSVSNPTSTGLTLGTSLGVGYTGNGTYNLIGGTLTAPDEFIGAKFLFGVGGNGIVNQTSGTNNISDTLYLGNGTTESKGTYNLSGSGQLNVGVITFVGDNTASGIFNQSGGTYTANLTAVGAIGGNGKVNVSGTAIFNSSFRIGNGTFNQSGGIVNAPGEELKPLAFGAPAGVTYNQTGGTNNTNFLDIRAGTYNLSVGTLNIHYVDLPGLTTEAPPNTGTFNLKGGTLNVSANTEFDNGGQFNYSGGSLNANYVNTGRTLVTGGGTRIFNGPVINGPTGYFKATATTVGFNSFFANHGIYQSDPATNIFTTISNDSSAIMIGGTGDKFVISGDFLNTSTQNTSWKTDRATLGFTGAGPHEFHLASADLGRNGFSNNFSWGALSFDLGAIIDLVDGNSTPGAALYIRELDLPGNDLSLLSDLVSPFNIYYDISDPANAYLGGITYSLDGGGLLVAGSASVFAGNPQDANCTGESTSALSQQYGGLSAAAKALGYDSVKGLHNEIRTYCNPPLPYAGSISLISNTQLETVSPLWSSDDQADPRASVGVPEPSSIAVLIISLFIFLGISTWPARSESHS